MPAGTTQVTSTSAKELYVYAALQGGFRGDYYGTFSLFGELGSLGVSLIVNS